MGRLISSEKRARARDEKRGRMRRIRAEALRSFSKMPYVEITLDGIGQRAGVKKGFATMYFGTREELFLELLRDELEAWYLEIEERLAAQRARLPAARLARLLATTIAARGSLTRLLALAPVVLEQNKDILESDRFQRWQRDRMAEVATQLERRSRSIGKGRALRFLHLFQLTASALQPFADPKGSLAFNLHEDDFADLRIDLGRDLEDAALRLLAGHGEGPV